MGISVKTLKEEQNIIDASPYISLQGLVTSQFNSKGINIVGIEKSEK